jgi:hypothetical protein
MSRLERVGLFSRRRLLAASLFALLPLAGLVPACGDDESDPIGPGPVTELEIVGGTSLTLAAGTSEEVEVGGLDASGDDNHDAEISATSSNPAIVTVTGGVSASRIRLAHTGFDVTGVAAGSATITFEEVNTGVTADLAVTVTP